MLTACASDSESAEVDTSDRPSNGVSVSTDGVEAQIGRSERPDWLPVWLLLPDDLEITLSLNDERTGEANVTGFISGGDFDKLLSDLTFMVQSGGYVIGETYEGGGGSGFNAQHTGDEGDLRAGVIQIDDNVVQWSIEFSFGASDDATETTVGDQAGTPSEVEGISISGPGAMTMMVAGETLVTEGQCFIEGSYGNFIGLDGVSNLTIREGENRTAEGNLTQTVGGVEHSWFVDATGAPRFGISTVGMRYEGSLVTADGSVSDTGTIDVVCE